MSTTEIVKKSNIKRPIADILVLAIEHFTEDGVADVRCDDCGCLILFEEQSDSTTIHHCLCGKYNGTLRGI